MPTKYKYSPRNAVRTFAREHGVPMKEAARAMVTSRTTELRHAAQDWLSGKVAAQKRKKPHAPYVSQKRVKKEEPAKKEKR